MWIATGGVNGGKWTEKDFCNALEERNIVLFPDLGYFDKWSGKAKGIQSKVECKIIVSPKLENITSQEQRPNGLDLADFVLTLDKPSGTALTEEGGYPIIWDF